MLVDFYTFAMKYSIHIIHSLKKQLEIILKNENKKIKKRGLFL